MKRAFSVLAFLLLCFSMPVSVSASTVPLGVVQLCYEKANTADSKLYINGNTATCESPVRGKTDVVKITIVQTLEKQGFLWIWSTYDDTEWRETVYTNSHEISNTKSGLDSGKYRLKTVFTLTDKDGKSETITVYSDEQKVG